jgi:membrane protein
MATEPLGKPAGRRAPRPTRGSMTGRFQRVIATVEERARLRHGTLRRRIRALIWTARLLLQVVRQWIRDRCPQQASSLAFQTALSLVPLCAIGLAVLRTTGAFEAESTLVDYISRQILPVSRDEVSRYLVEWAGNLSFKTAGVVGILFTVTLSFVMFNSVENIFNDIWRVERRRNLGAKFIIFYAVATIVPALLGLSLYQAARYGLTRGLSGFLGGLAATWLALLLANKLLPATPVRWKAAALGAFLSALAFEAAKLLFHQYVVHVAFQRYAGVYGAIGLLPILLIWIYYSWLVILLGAEVAHAVQRLHEVEGLDKTDDGSQPSDGVLGARVLVEVVSSWKSGDPIGATRLAHRLPAGLHAGRLEDTLVRLEESGLITRGPDGACVPGRPPEGVTLAEVLAVYRPADGMILGDAGTSTTIANLVAEEELARQK